jgi:hypothetical protein
MKAKITWSNVKAYFQGKIREKFVNHKYLYWLIPHHIFEQIQYRIFIMRKECYRTGSCILCGCDTPALQMADKACSGKCYPEMMDETSWFLYKQQKSIEFRYWDKSKPRKFELRITNNVFRV